MSTDVVLTLNLTFPHCTSRNFRVILLLITTEIQ